MTHQHRRALTPEEQQETLELGAALLTIKLLTRGGLHALECDAGQYPAAPCVCPTAEEPPAPAPADLFSIYTLLTGELHDQHCAAGRAPAAVCTCPTPDFE